MEYQNALQQIIEEGAIRLWRVNAGWSIAYRLLDGNIQARGLHKIEGDWQLGARMVSSYTYLQADGWYQVDGMHAQAEPILSKQAEKNEGYFIGIVRQCQTCQKYRPASMFSRDMNPERNMRTWECDICADERSGETSNYRQHEHNHIGDIIQREGHSSRATVEGQA